MDVNKNLFTVLNRNIFISIFFVPANNLLHFLKQSFINILGYKVRFESSLTISTCELINTAIKAFNSEDEQTRAKYLSDVLTNGIDNVKVQVETAHGYVTYMTMVDRYNFRLSTPLEYNEYLYTYHFRLD